MGEKQAWRDGYKRRRKRLHELKLEQQSGKPLPERGTPEYVEWMCRTELIVFGFAAVKTIAKAKKEPTGSMRCPLCQRNLIYSTTSSNGHMRALCETAECINCME